MNRLRTDSLKALQFLVDFTEADLASLSNARVRHFSRGILGTINRGGTEFDESDFSPDRAALSEYQAKLRPLFKGIAKHEEEDDLKFVITDALVLSFWAYRRKDVFWVLPMGIQLHLLLYQTIRLLEDVGVERLRACPDPKCGRLFVKVTKKEYCSTQHQMRVYMRKKREEERREREENRRADGKKTRTR